MLFVQVGVTWGTGCCLYRWVLRGGLTVVCTGGYYLGDWVLFVQVGVTWGLTCLYRWVLPGDRLLFVQVGVTWELTVVTWGLAVVCTGGCYLGTDCCLHRWVLPGD